MKFKRMMVCVSLLMVAAGAWAKHSAIQSCDTGYTVTKVRHGNAGNQSFIAAASYEGTLLRVGYDGRVRWENPLSGYMVHDVWCADLTGDGIDEVLVANADGHMYCLNGKDGEELWRFKQNDAPMYAVCTVRKGSVSYVVCGGFDKSIYYLSATGELVKEIESSTYSKAKPWSRTVKKPADGLHTANFLRPIPQADGTEILAVVGTFNHMQNRGHMYLFQPLADQPFQIDSLEEKGLQTIGDFRLADLDGNGKKTVLLGTSPHINDSYLTLYDPAKGSTRSFHLKRGGLATGYDVTQTTTISHGASFQYFIKIGNQVRLVKPDLKVNAAEVLTGTYAYNDMCKNPETDQIVFASAQSGGSCIHIIDTQDPSWKKAYEDLTPPGKIATILKNSAAVKKDLATFRKPQWERNPLPVYLMTEVGLSPYAESVKTRISENYNSPLFMANKHTVPVQSAESWNRDAMPNEEYRRRRNSPRRSYTLTQQQVLDQFAPLYEGAPGLAIWGGHGNDPYYYSPETKKKLIDQSGDKKLILIYPELGDHTKDFEFVLNDLLYPVAEYAQGKNANIFIRSKEVYWQGTIYLPMWKRFISGEFADVFVPALEETTDKLMELSIAGRLGLWGSGAVDAWGTRVIMDNTCMDRSRQFGFQRLPNHFLRNLVYHVSSGAQYLNNFPVDQDYMSVLWELIAEGVIYVPKREEIVSFSPVHLGMTNPDHDYVERAANGKWTTFYDEQWSKENPMVFSRLNGSWFGAAVTDWDFSRYAAGIKDRRLHFLPPYSNGMVLITPPQEGVFADADAPRGKMTDHLHPLYRPIMKEYITDGRNYYSADGKQTFAANEYYKQVEADIEKGASKIPLTVTGEVAWVCAQTAPNHLRLTLIDGGYINPSDKTATVTFHTVKPKRITDVLGGGVLKSIDPASLQIDIPCGLFRFIDIELEESL